MSETAKAIVTLCTNMSSPVVTDALVVMKAAGEEIDRLRDENARLREELDITDNALAEACLCYEDELAERDLHNWCPFDNDPQDFDACLTQERPCVAMQRNDCWKAFFKRIHGRKS